jgi:hypothetical protein
LAMLIFSTGKYAGTLIISILSRRGPSIFRVELEVQIKMH